MIYLRILSRGFLKNVQIDYPCQIYQLVCSCGCGKMYIGSTTATLRTRWMLHRATARDPTKMSQLYMHMREVGAHLFGISLVYDFRAIDWAHHLQVEQEWIQMYDAIANGLNSQRAFVTKEEKRAWLAEYRKTPKFKAKEKERTSTPEFKARMAEYRASPKRQAADAAYRKKIDWTAYCRENQRKPEAIAKTKLRLGEKKTCCCGAVVTHGYMPKHMRLAKHHERFEQVTLEYIYG
jgi:hypothetical protein